MGIRDWLFETESEPEHRFSYDITIIDDKSEGIVEEVEVKNTMLDGLVDNIYLENNLADKNKSIFKVQEAIAALPAEMPTGQKWASVVSILQISGLSTDVVLSDAESRLQILVGAKQNINRKNAEKIATAETEVENLTAMIATINQNIYETRVEDEQASKLINDEVKVINDLVDFLGKGGEIK